MTPLQAAIADDDASLLALSDADAVFKKEEKLALTSEALVTALVALPDRPWRTWRRGSGHEGRQPMTGKGLFTYEQNAYTGTMTMDIQGRGTMTMKYTGKRLGDCTK